MRCVSVTRTGSRRLGLSHGESNFDTVTRTDSPSQRPGDKGLIIRVTISESLFPRAINPGLSRRVRVLLSESHSPASPPKHPVCGFRPQAVTPIRVRQLGQCAGPIIRVARPDLSAARGAAQSGPTRCPGRRHTGSSHPSHPIRVIPSESTRVSISEPHYPNHNIRVGPS